MSRLSLYLLGSPRIERESVPIKVDTRKAIALLAYLAITGEIQRRDALVNLLWPEYDRTHGRAALRRTLSALRSALAGDCMDVDRETVCLDPSAEIWLDVDQFRGLLAQCLAHGHPASGVCPVCLPLLTDAVALYRGDFMSGFSLRDSFNFDDWQFFQSDALRREFADALAKLVRGHSAQGTFEPALRYARRWLALDRLDEGAHAQLMRLYAWTGQRSAALRQYEECVTVLEAQLGVPPQPSTAALYDAVRDGRVPRPPMGLHRERTEAQGAGERELPSLPPLATLEGEKRIVTILLADASTSFRRIGDLSPEDEALLVRRSLRAMEEILPQYGGNIDRTLGRSALIVFGMTRTRESDPELAIRAAIAMRREGRKLGLSVAAGISTGQVYLGSTDADGECTSALMGSAVDLAVRLGGRAQAGQILVDESTYRLTRRAFAFTPRSLTIEGIDEPIAVHQVDRLLPQPKKARGIEGLRAELVGRDEELARLKTALDRTLQGNGQIVSLIGEAGVGKSRLVAELRTHALASGGEWPVPLWLEGRCLELGTAASYAPFIDILQGYFAWLAQEDDLGRGQRIVSSLFEMVERGYLSQERIEEIGPLLGGLLSARFGNDWDGRFGGDTPEQLRRRMFYAVRDFLSALSRQQPLVLVLEDLHWADSLSMDLLSMLMEGLDLKPLLLLCVYRPEREHKCSHLATIASQKCREHYAEVRLCELTDLQSQRLVVSLLNAKDVSLSVKDLILRRSQGNPFFIEEVVRSLIDAGILCREGDAWLIRDARDVSEVPDSVQGVILSRLDHLSEDLRRVLRVASVIGRVFRRPVLQRAMQWGGELESLLWELEDRELIYQERTVPEVEYSFKHVLTQEAVYGSILRHRREAIHRQVGTAIEALYQENLDENYEQLAYHYDRGGVAEKAVAYLLQSGEKAKRGYANEEAIAHLTRGLKLLKAMSETLERDQRELELQVALGVPLVLIKGHAAPEVERTYARARELCDHVGDASQRFQVLLGLRRFYFMRGKLRTAYELGEQLLSVAQSIGDAAPLSRAHMMQGETLYWLGEFVQGRKHCEEGLDCYDATQRRVHVFRYGNDTEVGCRIYGALALWHLGYPDKAMQEMQEMLAVAEELSHPFTLVFALHFVGILHGLRREGEAVQEQVEAVLRISEEQGFALYWAWGTVLGGWTLIDQGREEEGTAQVQEGMAAWRARGGAEATLPTLLAFLAEAYGRAGRVEEGLGLVAEALGLVEENEERCWEAELNRLEGELSLIEGKEEQAETCFQRALEVARRQRARSWELRAATSLGRLWRGQGKGTEARKLLRGIYDQFSEGFDTADLQEAKSLLDVLA